MKYLTQANYYDSICFKYCSAAFVFSLDEGTAPIYTFYNKILVSNA